MSNPRRRDSLSATLKKLRENAGLPGTEAARRAGMSQASVSRFENGKRVPTDADIRALCEVYGASPTTRRELLALAGDLREGTSSTRTLLHRAGAPAVQQRISRLEKNAALVRSFQPSIVVGLLQTPDYSRALLSGVHKGQELDDMVAARQARKSVLDGECAFRMVLTEGALRWHIGSPQIMAGQLDYLILASELATVQLGVVPWTRPVTHPVLHGFQIYDRRAVMLGTENAVAVITDSRDVTYYEERFKIYADLAVFGEEARAELRRIADDYRGLS